MYMYDCMLLTDFFPSVTDHCTDVIKTRADQCDHIRIVIALNVHALETPQLNVLC